MTEPRTWSSSPQHRTAGRTVLGKADRATASREAARVLRPGGTVAVVTWQGPKPSYPPRDVFSVTLLEFGLRASDRDQGSHNGEGLLSASAAGAELERAGLFAVRAAAEPLGYRFEPHSFLGWKEYLDERQVFQGLDRRQYEPIASARSGSISTWSSSRRGVRDRGHLGGLGTR